MALKDQPYFPFYVKDFDGDEKLKECGAEATGVYIRIMCLMHKSKTYGKLLLEQKYQQSIQQNDQQNSSTCTKFVECFAVKLKRHLPYSLLEIERGLCELIENEVIHVEGNYIIQKRMVKDGRISDSRSSAGKKSAAGKGGINNFVGTKLPTNSSTKNQQNTAIAIVNEIQDKDNRGIGNTEGVQGNENLGEEGKDDFIAPVEVNLINKGNFKFNKEDLQMLQGMSEDFKDAWLQWLNYIQAAHPDKDLSTGAKRRPVLEGLVKLSEYNEDTAIKIISYCKSKNWKNFFKLELSEKSNSNNNGKGRMAQDRGPEPGPNASPEDWERWYYGKVH